MDRGFPTILANANTLNAALLDRRIKHNEKPARRPAVRGVEKNLGISD